MKQQSIQMGAFVIDLYATAQMQSSALLLRPTEGV